MKTFGELSRAEQVELFEALLDGKMILTVAAEPMSFDWSVFKPEYRWAARDADGCAFIYNGAIHTYRVGWSSDTNKGYRINHLASYVAGTVEWDQSLIVRPEGV